MLARDPDAPNQAIGGLEMVVGPGATRRCRCDNPNGELARARERLVELDRESSGVVPGDRGTRARNRRAGRHDRAGPCGVVHVAVPRAPDVFATRWRDEEPGKDRVGASLLERVAAGRVREAAGQVCRLPTGASLRGPRRRRGATSKVARRRASTRCSPTSMLADRLRPRGPGWREDVGALRDSAREWTSQCSLSVRVQETARTCGCCLTTREHRAARAVGKLLLTRAMRRRSMSMASYDRLFPNQVTMPAGGFGNLIALPLQHARRAEGCTVFLGEDLAPCPDQWIYLAGVRRLDGEQAEQIAADAERAGGTLGLPERTVTKTRARPRQLTATPSSAIEICLTGRVEVPPPNVAGSPRPPPANAAFATRSSLSANARDCRRTRRLASSRATRTRAIGCSSRGVVWRPSSTRSKRPRQRDRP